MSNVLKGVLFFGVLAPPIGSLVFTCTLALELIFSEQMAEIVSLVGDLPGIALFSYIFGGAPALVTGAIAGGFRYSLHSKASYLAVGILAGVLSAAFGAGTQMRAFDWPEIRTVLILFWAPGLLSGTVTAVLFRPRRENSFGAQSTNPAEA